jgi:hypothetical protein
MDLSSFHRSLKALVGADTQSLFWIWHEFIVPPEKATDPKASKKSQSRQTSTETTDDDAKTGVTYNLPSAFAELTMDNLLFACGHTYNVGRMKRGEKDWEGKKKGAGKMRFMAYCANQKDDDALAAERNWGESDPTIKLQHIHTISRLSSVTEPGREPPYTHDWNLSHITVVDPPIFLPSGVGQNGRYANDKNKHLIGPFHKVCKFLETLCISDS